ncbi:unnamed protein product [Meganyctiphanes norvegica]|uniref:C2H2-type domain-containing protein n=1 Tax=Meganyctiphanes norvegica TaxID=48144 RepID=A0AAV2S876_MEGNR
MMPSSNVKMSVEELYIATLDLITTLDAATFSSDTEMEVLAQALKMNCATMMCSDHKMQRHRGHTVFNASKHMRHYKHLHRDHRRFKCSQCSNAFQKKEVLKEHEKIHKGGGLECARCGLKKKNMRDMVLHIQQHVMENRFLEKEIKV